MNRDDVIRLAEKAGIAEWWNGRDRHYEEFMVFLCSFAALVEAESKPARKKKPTYDALGRLVELGVDKELAEAWIRQKKVPLSELAIALTVKQAEAAKFTLNEAVEAVVLGGWQGFRKCYVEGKQAGAKLSRALNTSGKDYGDGGRL